MHYCLRPQELSTVPRGIVLPITVISHGQRTTDVIHEERIKVYMCLNKQRASEMP